MKARPILIAIFYFLSMHVSGQTKMIAHKSHSGSAGTFILTIENNLFDVGNSNFGEAPRPTITLAKLDSVIFISDTVAIMVTSNNCENKQERDAKLWRAGKDTVYHHPLFSRQHSLDSIKSVLQWEYYFRNPVDSVKFINFDNEKSTSSKKKKSVSPLPGINDDSDSTPFDNQIIFIMAGLALFSLLMGLYSRKQHSMKLDVKREK